MRIIILLLSFCILWNLIYRSDVKAHSDGPPYIKVNGEFTKNNPLATYTFDNKLTLGHISPAQNKTIYPQSITLMVDEAMFVKNYQSVDNFGDVTFRWEIEGNGSLRGSEVLFAPPAPGTYFIDLKAKTKSSDAKEEFVSLEILQIDVLPTTSYQKPQAVIKINNQRIDDPIKQQINLKENQKVTLDATFSKGNIKEYIWDLGDGELRKGKTIDIVYKNSANFSSFPILRVIDNNNISNDSYIYINTLDESNGIFSKISGFFKSIWAMLFN